MGKPGRALNSAATLAVLLLLTGCSGDDVELNGKIFDAMGVSPSNATKSKEPKMVARGPLVIPPGVERLPQPGKPPEAAAHEMIGLTDPDAVAARKQADLEAEQAEYCKKNYEYAKAHGDSSADSAVGPLGPCRGSILSGIKKYTNFGGSAESGVQPGQVEE